MLETLLPNFESETEALHRLAPAGWIMGFNITYTGPEYLVNQYPDAWRRVYEERNYFIGDPVLMWTIGKSGVTRWSAIRIPDMRGVMRHAAEYGLAYGAAFSRKVGSKRSFLTLARSDREFTDEEIAEVDEKFNYWVDLLMNRAALTEGELEVLRCFRDGMGQRETAEELAVSELTVKQRSQKACQKLGATTRTQAVVTAVTRGYI